MECTAASISGRLGSHSWVQCSLLWKVSTTPRYFGPKKYLPKFDAAVGRAAGCWRPCRMAHGLLAAFRGLRLDHPELGPKLLLAKLRGSSSQTWARATRRSARRCWR